MDAATDHARKHGGTVHVEPRDVAGYGRYAVIADPEQAPVMVLRPSRQLGGSQGFGSWIWTELWARDLKAAASFYHKVVGYERTATEVGGAPYLTFSSGETARAGLVRIPDEKDTVESAWAPYLRVADLQATVDGVRRLGGSVLVEPGAFRSRGSVALVADPTGAAFFIYQAADQEVEE